MMCCPFKIPRTPNADRIVVLELNTPGRWGLSGARSTISLSLSPDRFARTTGRLKLPRLILLEGLYAAFVTEVAINETKIALGDQDFVAGPGGGYGEQHSAIVTPKL